MRLHRIASLIVVLLFLLLGYWLLHAGSRPVQHVETVVPLYDALDDRMILVPQNQIEDVRL